jgi:hypothetical protein
MESDISSDNPPITIQILPSNGRMEPLPTSTINSQYNDVYGRGKIFEVIQPNDCQKATIEKVKLFDKELGDLGVKLNYIMVSLYSEDFKLRYNVPHIFFSGNVETVSEHVFINLSDLLEKFPLKIETQEKNSEPTSSYQNIVRKTFLKGQEPTEHAKKQTLQYLAEKYFKGMFYGLDDAEFFVFPIHQLQQNRGSSLNNKKNKEPEPPIFVLSSQSDILTCQFRDFIYTLFASREQIERNLLQEQKINQILDILSNVISHANNNSESETRPDIQRSIMRSVLTEQYIRENTESLNILREVFDVHNFDDIFGRTGKESHDKEASIPAMSKCFLHSEQAYLNRLFSNQINVKEFIIACMYEAIHKSSDQFSIESSVRNSSVGNFFPSSSGLTTASKGELTFEEDENEEGEGEIKTPILLPQSSEKKDKATGDSEFSLRKEKEKEIEIEIEENTQAPSALLFHFDVPLTIDIISPRHICKYCRGSLHLRFNEIQSLFGQDITITPINEKVLNRYYKPFEKIIPQSDQDNIMGAGNKKPSSETHGRLYTYCNDRRHSHREYASFVSEYQKFKIYQFLDKPYSKCKIDNNFVIKLKNLRIQILATSFKNADENIIGRMEYQGSTSD